ncbi:hypothetical protein ACFFX0_14220 [Citricoccus parietis]|uniref:Secreted protein n=1 Tax=Citricoccus parietis TaxID=592307 RepID=A0ABV5G030_9MICC
MRRCPPGPRCSGPPGAVLAGGVIVGWAVAVPCCPRRPVQSGRCPRTVRSPWTTGAWSPGAHGGEMPCAPMNPGKGRNRER